VLEGDVGNVASVLGFEIVVVHFRSLVTVVMGSHNADWGGENHALYAFSQPDVNDKFVSLESRLVIHNKKHSVPQPLLSPSSCHASSTSSSINSSYFFLLFSNLSLV
jgi:hypothetical protein